MKILVAGLGSAGQRHVRNLQRLCAGPAEILAWRPRGWAVVVDEGLDAVYGRRPEEAYGLTVFTSLDEALAAKPDAVIVPNPIFLHVETALAAVKIGCHVFIEKPVSDRWEGIGELLRFTGENSPIGYVGYQMRFHPGLRRVKEYLDEGTVGNIASAYLHFGEYLPGMHPYEDYRDGHAARSEQGGRGALLESRAGHRALALRHAQARVCDWWAAQLARYRRRGYSGNHAGVRPRWSHGSDPGVPRFCAMAATAVLRDPKRAGHRSQGLLQEVCRPVRCRHGQMAR